MDFMKGFHFKQRTLFRVISFCGFLFFAGSDSTALAANKSYCLQVNYSAVPSLVNYRKITLLVNVGTCASVSVTADGGRGHRRL